MSSSTDGRCDAMRGSVLAEDCWETGGKICTYDGAWRSGEREVIPLLEVGRRGWDGAVGRIYTQCDVMGVSQRKEATLCLVRRRTGERQRMLISARDEAKEGDSMDDGGRIQCWRWSTVVI